MELSWQVVGQNDWWWAIDNLLVKEHQRVPRLQFE